MKKHEKHTSNTPLRRLLKAFGIGKEHGRESTRSEQLRRPARRAEAGNVFFTLFGAVAIVGVLGAGIMSTMRGPLTTMVEVNRIEEAKSVIRLNSRLVLQNATQGMGGDCDDDDFTEAPDPVSCTGTSGPTGGGCLPATIGATQTDPWGTPYGYCSWNHGPDPNTCTNTLNGTNDTSYVTIAIMSAGPDRQFNTPCAAHPGYPDDAVGDDILTKVPYNDAAAMAGGGAAGGLWTAVGTTEAEIARDLDVTGAGAFSGGLNVTGASTFGNNLVTTGTVITDSIESSSQESGTIDIDGTITAGTNGTLDINDAVDITGDFAVGGGTDTFTVAAGTGNTVISGTLGAGDTTVAALNATGAGDFDSTLNVDGIANFESTITSDGDGTVNIDDALDVTGATTLQSTLTINSDGTDATTDALVINNATPSEIMALDDAGNLEIAGALTANGGIADPDTTAGHVLVSDGSVFDSVPMTGDVAIDGAGDTTIQNDTITSGMIIDGQVDVDDIANLAVTNAKIANDAVNTDQLVDGAVNTDKIKVEGSDNQCLRIDGTNVVWEDCVAGGTGDGVGAAVLWQLLANGNSAYNTSTSTNLKIIDLADPDDPQDAATKNYVDTALGDISSSRIIDAPEAPATEGDTYIDVDTADPDDGLTNTTVFFNAGSESMRILDTGQVNMATHATIGGNLAVDTSVLFVDSATNDNVGIGTATPNEWTALDITSTTKGLLIPRLTSGEATTLGGNSPPNGTLIFNTDRGDAATGLLQFWDGTQWVDVGGGGAEGGGIWEEDDAGGNFIEYDNTLGGMRVGRIDGQPAPAIDWTLDVANSLVYTNHAVGIGVTAISDDSGSNTNVVLDLNGDIAAIEYCDANGANCFDTSDIDSLISGGGSLWTDNTTHITREEFHILNTGETMTSAGFDSASFDGLVFHTDKQALRFGRNNYSAWNEANIGVSSFAGGEYAVASGERSFAWGNYLDVTGDGSVGFSGNNDTIVSGANSFAFGPNLNINGIDNYAWGEDLDVAGTTQHSMSFKLGQGATTETLIDGDADRTFNVLLGQQDSVVLDTPEQISFLGGNLLIDPADPATQLVARGAIDAGAATDAIVLPSGTTGERPGTGVDGMLRFNSDTDAYEVYSSTASDWVNLGDNYTPTGDLDMLNYKIVNLGTPSDDADAVTKSYVDNALTVGLCTGGGEIWASQSAAANKEWQSITYGNGTFVAVARYGPDQVMTSPDGITWTTRTATADNQWLSVTYGNGTFVAVSTSGTNRVMTSPDGITWTPQTAAQANFWFDVTYGNGTFVAVSPNGTNRVMTSPDGITWTSRNAAVNNGWLAVTYGNGLFVAVAETGTNRVMTSPDGINWTSQAAAEPNEWRSVTYGNGKFVAVSNNGTNRVMTSPNGTTWTAQAAAENNQWMDVTYGSGTFIAVARDGTNRVMTSTNGTTWASQNAAQANSWKSVTYENDKFVAVATDGTNRVMTSAGPICTQAAAGTAGKLVDSTSPSPDTSVDVDTAGDGTDDSIVFTNAGAQSMIIDATGNVGIGTDSPASKLHISDKSAAGDSIVTISADETNTVEDDNPWIEFLQDGGATKGYIGLAGTANVFNKSILGYQVNALVLNTSSSNAYLQLATDDKVRMTIKNTGEIGIGKTATTGVELDVVGDIQYTGTLTDISDRRLKTDITPLGAEDMIARLSAVDTYTFRMKDDEKGQIEYGVMAQELEEVFPELVRTADDEMGTKSVNYTGLIAPMIEATKALKTQNDALKAELNAVKQQQQMVLATLDTMQSDLNGMKVHTGYGIEKGSAIAMLLLLLSLGGITATLLIQRQKPATPTKRT